MTREKTKSTQNQRKDKNAKQQITSQRTTGSDTFQPGPGPGDGGQPQGGREPRRGTPARHGHRGRSPGQSQPQEPP